MKYIRTKYDIFKDYDIDYCNTRNPESRGIKVSENLEELCDEFVCVRAGETYILDKTCNLKAQQKYIGDVYGAVWTNKGLIYVAKMNEKGELELL